MNMRDRTNHTHARERQRIKRQLRNGAHWHAYAIGRADRPAGRRRTVFVDLQRVMSPTDGEPA